MSEENQPPKPSLPNLIWIDLEMSGLDPDKCAILEIACIVTDGELERARRGHRPGGQPARRGARRHGRVVHASSRTERAHRRREGVHHPAARGRAAHARVPASASRTRASRRCAGSSVSHDRRFIDKYMPDLSAWLHYRTIDVSTVKELVKRWYGDVELPSKKNTHRALDDIRESIEELRYYREHAFRARFACPSARSATDRAAAFFARARNDRALRPATVRAVELADRDCSVPRRGRRRRAGMRFASPTTRSWSTAFCACSS